MSIEYRRGLVFFSGPSGAGKSTCAEMFVRFCAKYLLEKESCQVSVGAFYGLSIFTDAFSGKQENDIKD